MSENQLYKNEIVVFVIWGWRVIIFYIMDDWECGMIVILFNVHRDEEFHRDTIKIDDIMYVKHYFNFVCFSLSQNWSYLLFSMRE